VPRRLTLGGTNNKCVNRYRNKSRRTLKTISALWFHQSAAKQTSIPADKKGRKML
jgi:hypothetical protein